MRLHGLNLVKALPGQYNDHEMEVTPSVNVRKKFEEQAVFGLAGAHLTRTECLRAIEDLDHVLLGLGVRRDALITIDGRETEVRKELKDLYSTMEEAKADVMGIYNILALAAEGEISEEVGRTIEATYVAGLFRSARFGVHAGQALLGHLNVVLAPAQVGDDRRDVLHLIRPVPRAPDRRAGRPRGCRSGLT